MNSLPFSTEKSEVIEQFRGHFLSVLARKTIVRTLDALSAGGRGNANENVMNL
jgi:hypothetical protein